MQPQLQHAQQQQQQHPTVLTVRPLPPAPSPDAFVSAVSWWAPSAVLLCGTSRGSLFSLATVPPAPKRALSVAEFAPHAVDRLEYVAKWNALLSLSAGRIASHSLGPDGPGAALAPEPPVNTNEVGVVTFCCDVVSDRLCMSMKRRVLVLRRVYASSQAPARFELVNVTEIEGLPRELGWAVERVGVRWLLVGTEDALTWINTDVKTQETPDKLLPASLLHAGRTNDEVLVVRGASASFSAPRELSRGEFDFPSAVASVALCCPFVLGMGATGEVFVHLDSGAAMQVLRVKPIVRFALAACASGGGAGGGSVAFGAGAWGSPLPMADMVPRLLEGALFQQALAVCQARWAPEHAWAADRARAEELRAVASRAYALHLLLQPAGCSAQDVAKAAELLKGLASLHEVLGLFADSDLFASAEEARSCVGDQAELRNVKFRPGALPAALRELLLPLLLESSGQSAMLDSLILRALVLGRPGRGASAKTVGEFDARKARFLSAPNLCSVEESDRLLLQYPEMWQDHAMLLVGKGQERRALEWLRTLGLHAARDDERYARASVDMMRPFDVPEFAGWVLEVHPLVGVEAVAKVREALAVAAGRRGADAWHAAGAQAVEAGVLGLPGALDLVRKSGAELALLERLVESDRGGQAAKDCLAKKYVEMDMREPLLVLVRDPRMVLAWNELVEELRPKQWHVENAAVLDRAGRRAEAAQVLAGFDVGMAEQYAAKSHDAAVLGVVFDVLLEQQGYKAALPMAERNAQFMDVNQVVNKLDDAVPTGHLVNLVQVALQGAVSDHRDHLIVHQLLKHENLMAMQALAQLKAEYVVMDKDKRCVVCGRPFKPDVAFVRLPESRVLAHVSCKGLV